MIEKLQINYALGDEAKQINFEISLIKEKLNEIINAVNLQEVLSQGNSGAVGGERFICPTCGCNCLNYGVDKTVWICNHCSNQETEETEVKCWKCGKGDMICKPKDKPVKVGDEVLARVVVQEVHDSYVITSNDPDYSEITPVMKDKPSSKERLR